MFKEKKTDLIRGIDKIKNNTIDVDELENVLEEKINERNELKKQHQILSLANKILKEANDSDSKDSAERQTWF